MAKIGVFPDLTPEEAAAKIPDGATVAFSGFTNAGAAKVLPRALAAKARNEHESGRPYRLRVMTGASCSESIDNPLAQVDAISSGARPTRARQSLRKQINSQEVEYVDMHLSRFRKWCFPAFTEK